jgi:two-component system, OmpR family, copper resistance phosphate regulon response regulator CusR
VGTLERVRRLVAEGLATGAGSESYGARPVPASPLPPVGDDDGRVAMGTAEGTTRPESSWPDPRRARPSELPGEPADTPAGGQVVSRILIAEDQVRIAAFVEKGLRAAGFTATVATEGQEALDLARSGSFDLVILDLGMPELDGFEILRELGERDRTTPVIILTGRESVSDAVAGLESGADDYMSKPFSFEELLARVRVRLRDKRIPETAVLRVGGCTLDLRTRRLLVEGRSVELTAREFALAEMFFRHPGQLLSREQLLSHVWGYDFDPGSNVVDVYVRYLRKKIGEQRITTARGMGYRLETET